MRNFLCASGLFAIGLCAFGCTDNSGNGPGNPGAGGSGTAGSGGSGTAGTTGTGGGGGTATGGAGGTTPGFMSVAPCTNESAYMTGTTIDFGLISGAFAYSPNCLKVPVGSTVTFSGDFTGHPLEPSTMRGNTTNNPITAVSANLDGAMTTSFTFPTAGFYAYFCSFHGSSDTGAGMAGVIWVQ